MDNQKYQTGLKRLWAVFVDAVVLLPFLLVEQWLYNETQNQIVIISWAIFISFLPIVYSIISHYKYGQTVGKWVANIKVLDKSESRLLTVKQSIARDIFYLAVQIFALIYFTFLAVHTGKTEFLYSNYKDFTNQPAFWWTIIELITMLTNAKKRALHDYLAKSVVVRI